MLSGTVIEWLNSLTNDHEPIEFESHPDILRNNKVYARGLPPLLKAGNVAMAVGCMTLAVVATLNPINICICIYTRD